MQALIFEGPDQLVLHEVPRPVPDAGEVLVRIHAAAICGTDVRILAGTKTREVRHGHPIGHECAGTVADVGEGVACCQPGDRVGVCVVVSCGDCEFCRADKENLCNSRITLGYHTDGAFAEYMLIPSHAVTRGNLFALPPRIPFEIASLLEPLACCLNGQHEMHLGTGGPAYGDCGEDLVIFGAGPIGLMHLLLARAKGSAINSVTVVEPREHRQRMAEKLGADKVCVPEEFEAEDCYDAAICAVGVLQVVPAALKAVRKMGKVSLFAGFGKGATVALDPNIIHYRQLRVTGASESRRRDYAEALSLVAEGRLELEPLLTHRFSLREYEQAFEKAADGSALKVAFVF